MSRPEEGKDCTRCGAPLLWVKGTSGKASPLDAEPTEDGNIWIDEDNRARYRSKALPIPTGVERYTSHFATCPYAQEFRRG